MIALKKITQYLPSSDNTFVKEGFVGLDFASKKINLVQFGILSSGAIAVKEYCSIPYSDSREELLASPKKLRVIIRKAFSQYDFSTKKIVSSIPSQDARIISVNYSKPKLTGDESPIIDAIRNRIEDDLSQYVIDYVPIRSRDRDSEQIAIVALVKTEVVLSYLEAFRHAGLQVEALEVRPASINRFIYSCLEKNDFKNVLAINFGETNSFLTITSGRRLLFDQQIDFGSKKILDDIASTLDVPLETAIQLIEKHGFDESHAALNPKLVYPEHIAKTLLEICEPRLNKLIDEVNRALLFSTSENHGESISNIYLLGSLAFWQGVDRYIENKVEISTKTIDRPLTQFEDPLEVVAKEDIHSKPDVAIAAGHALRNLVAS